MIGIAVTSSIYYTLTPTLSLFTRPTRFFSPTAKFPLRLRASSSTTFLDTNQTVDSVVVEKEVTRRSNPLACPVCYNSLTWITDPSLSVTPLVSFLYERGWRQTFSVWGGFPGPEKEGYYPDGRIVILDFCYIDYSENMLRQCYEFVQQEDNFPKENFILVRADIARLPFVTSSVDAVHAGAAIHCWPSPSTAVSEISRILRPGGVFVATTYILDGPFRAIPFLNTLRQNIRLVSGIYTVLSERELEALCKACGLVGFKCIRNGLFVMISASKPK
ncbi:hypothetical protein TSUD_148850 [Trifolium subterraneum]|uniref:Methyltransferase type 11 domain-containing protein n=1 Tax=Trifolium subterraneum TaxID=3900 RepID=A0A2Z6LXI5_TRISU|nr:hypothetical protein TSUD_148850 [Trifolium subterraneum]